MNIKYINHKISDLLTNATSVVLGSSDGLYGIKRVSDGAVIVANNTAVNNPSTGYYTYDVSALVVGTEYIISWKIVYDGVTTYVPQQFTATDNVVESDIPKSIKQAMLLLIGHLYEHREDTVEKSLDNIPLGIQALLSTYRVWGW
jgi:hypothetical protein